MKVWITKYALTDGIIEADGELGALDTISASWDNGAKCGNFRGSEWWRSEKCAIGYAERMRLRKIESLKRQIRKLEQMKFG